MNDPTVILDIIAATYKQDHKLKCFVESILCQTNPSWRLLIVHDGPDSLDFLKEEPKDKRITIMHTESRFDDWGHSPREIGLEMIKSDSYYTLLTNCDNYYVPAFIDEMCMYSEDLVYCDMAHSHYRYLARPSALKRGEIDLGAMVVRTDMAKRAGFKSKTYIADWDYTENILRLNPTTRKVAKILFIHN
jgi:hypothetical protein